MGRSVKCLGMLVAIAACEPTERGVGSECALDASALARQVVCSVVGVDERPGELTWWLHLLEAGGEAESEIFPVVIRREVVPRQALLVPGEAPVLVEGTCTRSSDGESLRVDCALDAVERGGAPLALALRRFPTMSE